MTKSEKIVLIGTVRFDSESGILTLSDTTKTTLRPQTAHVLSILAASSGQLVTKETLMAEVWQDTHVTDDSLVQCISEIRRALGPSDAKNLVTVPKQGYRLTAQLLSGTTIQAAPSDASLPKPSDGKPFSNRPRILAIGTVAILLAIFGAYLWHLDQSVDNPNPERTLAVLPFLNASENPEQQYLSNGVAEDLIVALSQLSDIRVVSRGASFAFSSQGADIRSIAEDLSADVILDGSVRQVGGDLRLTASLVDGVTGENIWAKQYDGDRTEILAFQSKVLQELTRALSVRLSSGERQRLGVRGTADVDAYDAYLKGRELENLYTRATNIEAEKVFQQAVARDSDFALAHAHLSQIYSFRVEYGWAENDQVMIKEAFRAAEKAVLLDPNMPFARFTLGRLFTRAYAREMPDARTRAQQELEKAIALDPNYVDAYAYLALANILNGDAAGGLPHIETAIERNPIQPYWYALAKGIALYFLDDFAAAEMFLSAARDQNPNAPQAHRYLVAVYGMLDRPDDAEWSLFEYEDLGHVGTVEAMIRVGSINDAGYRTLLKNGLRAAGVPEN